MKQGLLWVGAAGLAAAFALPVAADDFKASCIAKNASGAASAAIEQYCACLDKGSAGNASLRSELLAIMDLPRADRPAAIAKVEGGNAAVLPCVQQMRGG